MIIRITDSERKVLEDILKDHIDTLETIEGGKIDAFKLADIVNVYRKLTEETPIETFPVIQEKPKVVHGAPAEIKVTEITPNPSDIPGDNTPVTAENIDDMESKLLENKEIDKVDKVDVKPLIKA